MINSLEFLRLVDMNQGQDQDVYASGLISSAIDESIRMCRPWVIFHAPMWCLDTLKKQAHSLGFDLRVDPHNLSAGIREVTLYVKPEVCTQHQEERLLKTGPVFAEGKKVTV
jgi:hypothetical protein